MAARNTCLIITLIVLFLCAIKSFGADSLQVYHLRSDQTFDLRTDDGMMTPFWNDWEQRDSVSANCTRYVHEVQAQDGSVTITLKAAATTTHLFILTRLVYNTKAPVSISEDIPPDRLSFTLNNSPFAEVLPSDTLRIQRLLFVLLRNKGKISRYFYGPDPRPVAGLMVKSFNEADGDIIEVDSVTKIVELCIPLLNLGFGSSPNPQSADRRAIDIRYYPSRKDSSADLVSKLFVPGDTGVFENRFFLGDLVLEPYFNDSVFIVTSPVKDMQLTAGVRHTITWGYVFSGGVLGIDYSANGGTSWQTIVATTANDGAHSWVVPSAVATQNLLRLRREEKVVATSAPFSVMGPVPQLIPMPDSVSRLDFRWKEVTGATSYRIIIATDLSFSKQLVNDTVSAAAYTVSTVLPCTLLYWKVASSLDVTTFSLTDSFVNSVATSIHTSGGRTKSVAGIRWIKNNSLQYTVVNPGTVYIRLLSLNGRGMVDIINDYHRPGLYNKTIVPAGRNLPSGLYVLQISSDKGIESVTYLQME